MDRKEIYDKICEILSELLPDFDSSAVSEETLLTDVSASVDSMTMVELILALEEAFGVTIRDDQFDLKDTKIDDVIDFIVQAKG